MENVNKGLNDLSKNELIDSALLDAVSGGGCEVWVENCGCKMVPGEGPCCDWCGQWVPEIVPEASIT